MPSHPRYLRQQMLGMEDYLSRHPWPPACECGCGEPVGFSRRGRPNRFINQAHIIAISNRWSEPERAYRLWAKEGAYADTHTPFELGYIQVVKVARGFWVANMIGQHGIGRSYGRPPIRYEAIEECLGHLAQEALAKEASVHMPRIGCGLAGATWSRIEPIINRTLVAPGVPVYIYDLPE